MLLFSGNYFVLHSDAKYVTPLCVSMHCVTKSVTPFIYIYDEKKIV